MDNNQIELKFKTSSFKQLWFEFVEKHTELYEKTCEEYSHLLASELDELEQTVDEKQIIIQHINKLERSRNEVAAEMATLMKIEKPEKLNTMLNKLEEHKMDSEVNEIKKLNAVLLDIIEKIQEQNKKNQIFLNKAIISLNELRASFSGKENYKTYSPSGMTRSGLT